MGVCNYMAKLAAEGLKNNDMSLYDAILDGDEATIRYLARSKYANRIVNKGCYDETLNIAKIIDALEALLNQKNIHVRMC